MQSSEHKKFENFSDGPTQVDILQRAYQEMRAAAIFDELGEVDQQSYDTEIFIGSSNPDSVFHGMRGELRQNALGEAGIIITLPDGNGNLDTFTAEYQVDKKGHMQKGKSIRVSAHIGGEMRIGGEAAVVFSDRMNTLRPKMDEEIKMAYKKPEETLRKSQRPFLRRFFRLR